MAGRAFTLSSVATFLTVVSFIAPIAQVSADELNIASFGKDGKIAPDGNLKNWLLSGRDYTPELLSDRIILTPPYPGNKQGAIWTENPLGARDFLVDFEFRSTGPDHGQGQLQLWYTKQNQKEIAAHNVYSVGKFTGLALLIDQLGGRGGGIRAFLNDGKTDYSKSNVEHLPFGHCDYPYRNLGVPSKLQLHQDSLGLELLIDGKRCFKAENVFLPQDYYFGISANTGENPDSFEIFKFVTHTGLSVQRQAPPGGQAAGNVASQQGGGQNAQSRPPPPKVGGTPDSPMLNDIHSHVLQFSQAVPGGVDDIKQKLAALTTASVSKDELRALDAKLDRALQLLEKIAKEQRDWSGHFSELHGRIESGNKQFLAKIPESMGTAITTHGPSMMQIVFIVIAAQLLMGLMYIVYKRREATPKKYL